MNNNPPNEERISILLVDDHPENLIALQAILDRPDYELVTASSGAEALSRLLKQDFALILLDVFMPEMDGYEVASLIKQRPKTSHIPIIFLTAMAKDASHIFKAYELGAVDYIQKPLDANIVRAKVKVFAELYQSRVQVQRQAELLVKAEQARRELELQSYKQNAERKYQDLAEGIAHGIVWSADPESLTFSYVSPRAETLLGYPVSQWFEERGFWVNRLFPGDRDWILKKFQEARLGHELDFEHRIFTADGRIHWFRTGIRLARRGEGEGFEIRGLSVDITDMKQTEEALQGAIRIRDEFLSIASHELKTPITPIKLQVQTLARLLERSNVLAQLPPAMKGTIETLNRQVDRVAQLVENLLDVSRISSGHLKLNREDTDLTELTQEVVTRYCQQKPADFCKIILDCEGPITGNWDRLRIEQILVNLVTNALKYGNDKPFEVELGLENDCARISVVDHGIGIKPEDRVRVFQRFERAVAPSNFGGLGLGLYITQQIIQAHGGTIELESELQKGSSFTVRLPLRAPQVCEVNGEPGLTTRRPNSEAGEGKNNAGGAA